MSKKNKVNPDHYKQAGRAQTGHGPLEQELNKQKLTRAQARVATGEAARPAGEAPREGRHEQEMDEEAETDRE